MQKITLIGRLGRDAAVRVSNNNGNERFLSMTLATNSKIKGAEKTTWYDVISRNPRHIDSLAQYLTKGSNVCVVGELDAAIQERDGQHFLRLSVSVDSIDFVGGGVSGSTQNNAETTSEAPAPARKTTEDVPEDDMPKVSKKKPAPAPAASDDAEDLPF